MEPVHEISNKEIVQSVFPDAAEVKQINKFWYKIINSKGKVLGLAMNSINHCSDISGYNSCTPIMIITNKKGVVLKVGLLTHRETLSYIKRLENQGFFFIWNNKNLKEAQKVEPDAYSGATMTARAVYQNMQYMLENGRKCIPVL
jgi:Na+-translocating ferredoxin:NAD+ oxidoreductase RnfG subunit